MDKKNNGFGNSKSNPNVKKKKINSGFGIYYIILAMIFTSIVLYLATTKYFIIEALDVSGTNKYTKEQIIDYANVKVGTNLFKIDKKEIEKKLIENFEYIEDIKIRISFPPKVIYEIKQAEPFALVKGETDYLLISEKGRILEKTATPVMTRMPVVMGMNAKTEDKTKVLESAADDALTQSSEESSKLESDNTENSQVTANDEAENMDINAYSAQEEVETGGYITTENNETFQMLINLLDVINTTNFTDITKIDISDRLNMKIVYQDRLLIELGSIDNLEYKLNFVKQINEFCDETCFEGVVDATIPKQLRVREMDISEYLAKDTFTTTEDLVQIQKPNSENDEKKNETDESNQEKNEITTEETKDNSEI